jgi:hypothetical protein
MKKKATSKKRTVTPRLAPCSCEYNKGITAMFEESLKHLQASGPEPMEEYNLALQHSDSFQHMFHCLCEDEEVDPMYILSDLYRMGVESGKRQQEIQYLEKMVGLK